VDWTKNTHGKHELRVFDFRRDVAGFDGKVGIVGDERGDTSPFSVYWQRFANWRSHSCSLAQSPNDDGVYVPTTIPTRKKTQQPFAPWHIQINAVTNDDWQLFK